MITLTFAEFHKGNYDDKEEFHEMYIIKQENNTLYVGISSRDVWERWFSQWGGHIRRNGWGEYFHTSEIGRAVIQNMPESDNWIVELWTLEDCRKFFHSPLLPLGRAETEMIKHLHPVHNSMKNSPR